MRRISIIAIVISAFVTTTVAVLQLSHLFEPKAPTVKVVKKSKPTFEGGARMNDLGKMIHRSIVMDQKDLVNVGDEISRIEKEITKMQSEIVGLKGVKGNIAVRLRKLNVLRTVVEERSGSKVPVVTIPAKAQDKKDEAQRKPASNISKVKKLLDTYKKVEVASEDKNVRISVDGTQFYQAKSGNRVVSKKRFNALREALDELSKEYSVAQVVLRPGKGSNIAEVLQFSNIVKEELGHEATLMPASRKLKNKVSLEIVAGLGK